ncbi:LysE family translocator [Aureivirga sp. CE67]|uniref:LysE family translocator n=1 Tax=Aureivirga sp. CE67 TaxID=1788983 RepID=UPI0018CB5459|nr:LysE family transporter [Aureivirga sp. CE67]
MLNDILKAIPIGFGLSFMIGPVFFMLLQTSIIKGARAAIAFDLGVIFGDIFFILVAYFGSQQLLEQIKDDPRLYFFGGAVLFSYGLISYIQKKKEKENAIENVDKKTISKKSTYGKLFIKGFFLNFINIGVLGFWLLILIGIGPQLDFDSKRIFNFFAVIILSYFLTDLGKIFLAKQLQKKLTPKVILKIKHAVAIIIMICGILLLIKGFIPNKDLGIE